MAFASEYQRAAAAVAAADAAARSTHAALFDYAAELGKLVQPLVADGNPLGLGVRFIRRAPPHLDAPGGVLVEDAPKDRPPSFAAVVLETQDLWFEVRSDPTDAVAAATNINEMEAYAAKICGVTIADAGHPHLLQRAAGLAGTVVVPQVSTPAQLLEAFLVQSGTVFMRRASLNLPAYPRRITARG